MRRTTALLTLAALCVANGVLGIATAASAETTAVMKATVDTSAINAPALVNAAAGTAAAPATPTVPVMIVLDASGSMNKTDAPGPRIDAAKTAITNLIDTLPADTNVGLQVYGTGTGSTDADKTAGCTDIKTLAPVGPLDPAALKAQVAGVIAAGYTPIGNALRAAADALPNEGPRSIVLVSDGEDTCAPPTPCDVAGELHQQGVDLVVHTVGFKVDEAAREQLSCIAQATGGTYSDAADAGQLTQELAIKVDYATAGYTTVGTPVAGADQPSPQAPLLTPGQYVDSFAVGGSGPTLDAAGTTKYYTIPVQPGYRPYISATIIPPDATLDAFAEQVGLDANLTNIAQEFCTYPERAASLLLQGQNETATVVVNGPIFGDPKYGGCPTEGVALLEITRIGQGWADRPLPVEIVVRMEPPADASGLLPQASAGEELTAPSHGTPAALAGGSGFNDAPRLTSGATYQDTLGTGESRFYRIPMQWGQRLTYQVTEIGPAEPPIGITGSPIRVNLFNPVRSDVTDFADTNGRLWFANEPDETLSGYTHYPVRYTNRDGDTQRSGFSLDGDYYLRVNANRNDDAPSSTTFLVTVAVSGIAEPGPIYQAAGGGTGAAITDPATTRASTAQSAASSPVPSSPVTSASSSDPADLATTATGQASAVNSAIPVWVWGLIAVLAAGAVAALLVVRTRRRSASPGSPGQPGSPDQPGGRHW